MYAFGSRIRYSETDSEGRLTLNALLNYFQDCSTFHSEDVGLGIGYMVYVLFILAVVITGIVLFIVFRKRFALDPGQIPKGQRFKTVICNPGMLCYCIFWIVMILLQMFPEIVQMLLGISPLSL